MPTDRASVLFGFCLYAFGTKSITAVVFTIAPIMLTEAAKAAQLTYLRPTSVSSMVFGVSLLLQCAGALTLGELADARSVRLALLAVHVAMGVACELALGLLRDCGVLALAALQVALFYAMGISWTFYNAFLPLVASRALRPAVSLAAAGSAAVGGVGFLLLQYSEVALEPGAAAPPAALRRICVYAAAVWLATALPSLTYLGGSELEQPSAAPRAAAARTCAASLDGWRRVATQQPHTARFLLAQALYLTGAMSDGSIGTVFAFEVMGLGVRGLTLLTVRGVAAAACGAFATLLLVQGGAVRPQRLLLGLMGLSPLLALYASLFLSDEAELTGFAVVHGFVAGAVGFQGLNRGVYATMVPRHREAEMFSIWTVAIKALCWLGPLTVAALNQLSGSLRVALLASLLFYVPALVVMGSVDVDAGRREAEEASQLVLVQAVAPVAPPDAVAAAARGDGELGKPSSDPPEDLWLPPPSPPLQGGRSYGAMGTTGGLAV
eukprot:Transcript_17861.p1 GENE.Transcript_17861~~Transcript_17861.p1  ORF type:complete len:529 (-),score=220.97 Transcript_17861:56-1540(-)